MKKMMLAIVALMISGMAFSQGSIAGLSYDNVNVYFHDMSQFGDLPITVTVTVHFVNDYCLDRDYWTTPVQVIVDSNNKYCNIEGMSVTGCGYYSRIAGVRATFAINGAVYLAMMAPSGPYHHIYPGDFTPCYPLDPDPEGGTVTPIVP